MDAPVLTRPGAQETQHDYYTGIDTVPSLNALGILEQYRMNSSSFQREMEALESTGPPSPAGKDGTWQYTAIKLLNSPASSPRGARGSNLGLNQADGMAAYTVQPLQHPQPPPQPSRYHQQPAYGSVAITSGNTIGYPGPSGSNWPTGVDMLQQPNMLEAAEDGVDEMHWPSRLANNSLTNGSGSRAVAGGSEPARYSIDGITTKLGSSSLDAAGALYLQGIQPMENAIGMASNHMLQQQMHGGQGLPQVAVHAPMRQAQYVTTGMLDDAGQAARAASAAMALPTVAVPPAAYGPVSAPVLPSQPTPAQQQYQKRQRSIRSQVTFEAYENQYGPAAKCDSGPCADHCITPCKPHTCKCCKKHRRMEVAGAARSKGGYCGKCNRREKVEGLEFVKCNHTCIADGMSLTCGVEMLRDVFDNHWKQHKNEIHAEQLPMSLEVDTDEGRKCGACTNMRPVTYYPNQDTNCSCSHCQVVKSKGGASKQASDVARRVSNTSGAMGSTLFTSPTGGNARERRHSFVGTAPNTPRSGPSLTQLTLSDNNNDNMSQQISGQDGQWSSLNQVPVDSLPSPGTAQIINQWASAGNAVAMSDLPGLQSGDPVSTSGWGSNTPPLESNLDGMVQRAEAMLSSALASVMSARPTFDMLLTKCQQLRYQPGPEQQAAHAAVLRIVQAGKQVEKEAQNLLAQAAALTGGQ